MKIFNILIILSMLGSAFGRNIGKGLFMTDNHYDDEYSVGSPANCFLRSTGIGCCRKTDIPIKPYHHANVYGDYNCDSPKILVNDTMLWFSTHDSYDMIIWTGDSAGHHDITQSVKKNMNADGMLIDIYVNVTDAEKSNKLMYVT